jgi:ATP-dependent Clp protease ATP-binding subunit ClpC
MFGRYTERARRTLFFARHEASRFGSPTIEPEHLVLALIKELLHREKLRAHTPAGAPHLDDPFDCVLREKFVNLEELTREVETTMQVKPELPLSVEIPFSKALIRVLDHALVEADNLHHKNIGPEHLLVALLVERESLPAALLADAGLELSTIRQYLAALDHP